MIYGCSNDPKQLAGVIAFRDAAIADGWTLAPVYKTEPETSYGTLTKDGMVMNICAREKDKMKAIFPHHNSKWSYECMVSIWDAEGIHVAAPTTYSMEAILANATRCDFCGNAVDKTFRVAFANRSCMECRPAAKARLETSGWCD